MRLLTFFFSTLFLYTQLTASLHPGPCHAGIEGEVLFLRPSYEFEDFVSQIRTTSSLEEINGQAVRPRYRTGFRLGGVWGIDCHRSLTARYTQFYSGRYRREFSGINLAPAFVTTAQANLNFKYNAVDGLLNLCVANTHDFDLNMGAGLHYASIRTNYRTHYEFATFETINNIRSSHDFWGIGPELAFDFDYGFCSCFLGNFSFAANGRIMLLTSRIKATRETRTIVVSPQTPIVERAAPFWGVTPASDFKLGLSFDYSLACVRGRLEAGYEWIWYRRAARQILDVPSSNFTFSDVTFDGPYVSIGVIF